MQPPLTPRESRAVPTLEDMAREALDDHLKKMVKRMGQVRLIREDGT
jgi:hypothetical protein